MCFTSKTPLRVGGGGGARRLARPSAERIGRTTGPDNCLSHRWAAIGRAVLGGSSVGARVREESGARSTFCHANDRTTHNTSRLHCCFGFAIACDSIFLGNVVRAPHARARASHWSMGAYNIFHSTSYVGSCNRCSEPRPAGVARALCSALRRSRSTRITTSRSVTSSARRPHG